MADINLSVNYNDVLKAQKEVAKLSNLTTNIKINIDTSGASETWKVMNQVQKSSGEILTTYKMLGNQYDTIVKTSTNAAKQDEVRLNYASAELRAKKELLQVEKQRTEYIKNFNKAALSSISQKKTEESNTFAGIRKQAWEEWSSSFDKVNKSAQDSASVFEELFNTTKSGYNNLDNLSKKVIELNGGLDNSNSFVFRLGQSFSKLSTYISAITIINAVRNAIGDMVQQVKNLDASLVELKKVTDLEGSSLDDFTEKAFNLGNQIGRTGQEVVDATTVFARSGYDVQDALDLSKVALVMTNVGDGIGDVENAATSLISVLKAYNLEVSDAMHVTDVLNQVSNTSAINFEDLTEGVQRTGAVFAKSDTSLEELTGLLTGANEVMQNIEKTSSGLVTISQRLRGITEISDDGYEGVSKLSKEFKRIANIDIYDTTGQLRSTYDILKDMSEVFPTLTKNQQQYLAELAAGKRQVTVLQSLLGNWESVENAVENAAGATGSAMKENEKFLDSVQGKVNQLQSAWQDFSRKSIDANWIKNILSSGTSLIKLFDNLGNVLVVLSGIILTIKVPTLAKSFSDLKDILLRTNGGFKNILGVILKYPAAAKMARSENISLSDSYKALGISANTAQIAVATLTLALTAGILIYNKIKQNRQELISSLEDEAEKNDNVANSLQSALDEYQKNSTSIEGMDEATKKLNEALKNEGLLHSDLGKKINSEKDDRSEVIDTLKDEINQRRLLAQAKKEEAYETGKAGNIDQNWLQQVGAVWTGKDKFDLENFLRQNKNLDLSGLQDVSTGWSVSFGDLSGQWGESSQTIAGLNNELMEEIELLQQSGDLTEEDKKKQSAYIQAQTKLQTAIDAATNAYSGRFDMLKSGIDIGQNYENVLINLGIASQDEIDFYKSLIGLSEEERDAKVSEKEATDSLAESTVLFNETNENYIGTLKSNNEAIENTNKEIDDLQSAYESLSDALNEYNETGTISLDTFQELMNLSPEYISLLFDENGQLLDLDYATRLVTEAKIEQLGVDKASALINNAAKIWEEKGSLDSLVPTLQNATNTTWDMVEANLAQLESQGANTGALRAQVEAIKKWTAAAKASVGATGIKKRTGSSKSSSKSTKDVWKEEFTAQYEALKHSLNMEEITEQEYTDRLEVLYKKYFSDKTKYLDEYNKYEEEVYKNRDKIWKNAFSKEYDALKHSLTMGEITEKEYTDRLEILYKQYFSDKTKYLDEYTKYEEEVYNKRQKLLEDEIKALEDALDKQRELAESKYENAIKVATNAIEEQIEALEAQKDALSENNDEQERAIKLAQLQEELERAKSQKTVRVFYADRGWIWESDKSLVEEKEKALKDFQAETTQKEQEALIDSQINELKKLKDGWNDVASNYEMQQNKIKAALEMGTNFEAEVLEKRLDYLKKFVEEYNATMDKLGIDEKNLIKYASSVGIDISDKYASGTLSANGGLSVVGEQGAELRVLNKGDGIIPADLTRNLMAWGKFNPLSYFKNMLQPKVQASSTNDTIYNFSNLTINSSADNLDSLIMDIRLKAQNR